MNSRRALTRERLVGLLPLLLFLPFAGLPGCRTRQPQIQAPSAPLPAPLAAFVDQTRLLAGAGEARSLALVQGRPLPGGPCDVAVTLRRLSFQQGRLTASLATSGWVPGSGRGRECREIPATRTLAITGLAGADEAAAALEGALQTPEEYLAARGVAFHLEPGAAPTLAAAASDTGGTAEERQLRRQVTAWPKLLLAVQPLDHDPARRVRHEGEVEFAAIVGVDGRLHSLNVRTPLADRHADLVRRALSLWRYEPARKGDEAVAARIESRTTLRIR